MKRLPVDVSNFKKMIENNYLYIDKTEAIYSILQSGDLFFLSRPRRFGKSLLLSTLQELFSGNKQLFANLWISTSDYRWQEHPVIHLDFSEFNSETAQEFKVDLDWALENIAQHYGLSISKAPSVGSKFKFLIQQLAQKNGVVILIDEYDAPLLSNIDNVKVAQSIQKTMKNFFNILKSSEKFGFVRSIFITGVTKFAKTSVFSGLNNLKDITLNPKAAALLGYTGDELKTYFIKYAEQFAHKEMVSVEHIFEDIKQWYNGYRFSENPVKVYNPYSVIHSFDEQKLLNYWLETGTPSFLIELLKTQYTDLEDIETTQLSSESLGTFEIGEIPLIAILFQSGYLTIAHYDKSSHTYKLNYPNSEVSASFKKYILVSLTKNSSGAIERTAIQFKKALHDNNIELFCAIFKSLVANIPYQIHIGNEAYYHSLLQFLIDFLGLEGQSEISSSRGRIDMVLTTQKRIVIFEFKFNSTGKKALEQILEQKYYEKYMRFEKQITLVGLSFNVKNKELLLDWIKKDLTIDS